jgi:RNA polymerase sigma factor (TIGR02999 family)
MTSSGSEHATRLLKRMGSGDASAADELLPLVYEELHRLAATMMREQRSDHTLQPTALLHEAYLKLFDKEAQSSFESREHFLAVAAKAMRNVLVDHARRRAAEKRGGARERVTVSAVEGVLDDNAPDLLVLDEALTRLSAIDEPLARIVELRFFGGLSVEESARVLGVSEPTVVRGWRVARMWLERELAPPLE